jgi:hypothetical protein
MWGNTETLVVPAFTIPEGDIRHVSGSPAQSQLVDVRYLRPETWRFLFQAHFLTAPDPGLDDAPEAHGFLEVHFDLITGVGRSNIVIESFAKLSFNWASFEAPPVGQTLFTDSGQGYATISTSGGFADAVPIDQVTAQSIQLQARALFVINAGGSDDPIDIGSCSVSASAHFAPNVHVRPEWFLRRFDGDEQGVR